jgi:23S rRNA (adenine-C8)-methyltransferase
MIFKQIHSFLKENNQPDYRFDQILTAVFENRVGEFSKMTTLSKDLRQALENEFGSLIKIKPIKKQTSKETEKILFELSDKERIETVKMAYAQEDKNGWQTLCLSSQVGCGLGCKFCATGQIGLKRNLTAQEIIEQVLFFHLQGDKISNLVFMGMGEPLVNPDIFDALDILTNKKYFNFGQRKISISTVGIVPELKKLSKQYPQINIAFSLHTPFQDQRQELMPIAKQYSINQVMETLDEHIRKTNRKVFIPYLMIKDTTDTDKHLNALKDLLLDPKRRDISYLYHLNLIHYHQAPPITEQLFEPSNQSRVDKFKQELDKTKIGVTIRKSFGEEIKAACGQLYGDYPKN